jgi:hypothetical protein
MVESVDGDDDVWLGVLARLGFRFDLVIPSDTTRVFRSWMRGVASLSCTILCRP